MNHIGQYCFLLVSFADAEFKVYKRHMVYLRENKLRFTTIFNLTGSRTTQDTPGPVCGQFLYADLTEMGGPHTAPFNGLEY